MSLKKIIIVLMFCLFEVSICYANGKLDKNTIYCIENPDIKIEKTWQSNNLFFMGDGKVLFVSNVENNDYYFPIKDIETNEIKYVYEKKYRKALESEKYVDSDSGYRIENLVIYDKNKNVLFKNKDFMNANIINFQFYKNCLISNYGDGICIDINTGNKDFKVWGEYKEFCKNKNSLSAANGSNYAKEKNVIDEGNINSYYVNNKKAKGVDFGDCKIIFGDEDTMICDKNNNVLRTLQKKYSSVKRLKSSLSERFVYEFSFNKDDLGSDDYIDAYNNDFTLKIENILYVDYFLPEKDYIKIHLSEDNNYSEDNYGGHDSIYDFDFNLKKKIGVFEKLRVENWLDKKYVLHLTFVDDDEHPNKYFVYDLDFKLLNNKDIYDYLGLKNNYYLLTDNKTTKLYDKNNKQIMDLGTKMLQVQDGNIMGRRSENVVSCFDYYLSIKTKDIGTILIDLKGKIHLKNYEFIGDFNDKYFRFCDKNCYGFMNYNLDKLVSFNRIK